MSEHVSIFPPPGLNCYSSDMADSFPGRRAVSVGIVEQLEKNREHGMACLILVGTPGSGKTSLVEAGVWPLLQQAQSGTWRHALLRPGDYPAEPLRALAGALLRALPELGTAELVKADDFSLLLAEHFAAARLILGNGLELITREENQPGRLLLVVDALEEIFLDETPVAQRELFFCVLRELAATGVIHLLATLRKDWLPRARNQEILKELLESCEFPLPPPDQGELEIMINQLARQRGLVPTPEISRNLLEVMARYPEDLSLLQCLVQRLAELAGQQGTVDAKPWRKLGPPGHCLFQRAQLCVQGMSEEDRQLLRALLNECAPRPQADNLPLPLRRPRTRLAQGERRRHLLHELQGHGLLYLDDADRVEIPWAAWRACGQALDGDAPKVPPEKPEIEHDGQAAPAPARPPRKANPVSRPAWMPGVLSLLLALLAVYNYWNWRAAENELARFSDHAIPRSAPAGMKTPTSDKAPPTPEAEALDMASLLAQLEQLAAGHEKRGEQQLAATGDIRAAYQAYQRALELRRQAYQEQPTEARFQALLRAHSRLGQLGRDQP